MTGDLRHSGQSQAPEAPRPRGLSRGAVGAPGVRGGEHGRRARASEEPSPGSPVGREDSWGHRALLPHQPPWEYGETEGRSCGFGAGTELF